MAVNFAINVVVNPAQAQQGAQQVAGALQAVEQRAERLGRSLSQAFAILGLAKLFRDLTSYGDALQTADNKIRTVVQSAEALLVIQQELFDVAEASRSSYEATATLFQRLDGALKGLGTSQADVLRLTELINKAVIISGASAQEASQGVYQLSQAFNKGKLDGDELKTILEALPFVTDLLAKQLGVARGEIASLGAQGRITGGILMKAFSENADFIDGKWGQTTKTLGQSFVQLRNDVLYFIQELDRATGIFEKIGGFVEWLGQKFKAIGGLTGEAGQQRQLNLLAGKSKEIEDLIDDKSNYFEKVFFKDGQRQSFMQLTPDAEKRLELLTKEATLIHSVVGEYSLLKENLEKGWDEVSLVRSIQPLMDPKYRELLTRTNEELNKENELLGVNTERREVLAKVLDIEEKFRRQKTDITPGDLATLDERLTQLQRLKTLLTTIEDAGKAVFKGMEDALVSFATTGKLEFKKFADQVVADLLRIALQSFVTRQLMAGLTGLINPMFGLGQSTLLGTSGFDLGLGAGSTTLTRFATGGSFTVGGHGGTDTSLVRFLATPGEQVSVTRPGQGGDAAPVINVINNSGAPVETQQRSSGGATITDVIIGEVSRGMARGAFDAPLRGRFGSSPAPKRR
jgi:tape measure domain-containing protein